MQQKINQMQEAMNAARTRWRPGVHRLLRRRRRGGQGQRQKGNAGISIKPEVVDPADVEMLQDLVVSAVNEALRQAGEAWRPP
jgi:DNA-binding protein YbaB